MHITIHATHAQSSPTNTAQWHLPSPWNNFPPIITMRTTAETQVPMMIGRTFWFDENMDTSETCIEAFLFHTHRIKESFQMWQTQRNWLKDCLRTIIITTVWRQWQASCRITSKWYMHTRPQHGYCHGPGFTSQVSPNNMVRIISMHALE